MMTNEDFDIAISALLCARKFIQKAHDDAENKHDSYGEFYMDSVQYEIMKETENLLNIIDKFNIKKIVNQ